MLLFSLALFATMAVATTVCTLDWICQYQRFHYLFTAGPPNRLTPPNAWAPLAVPLGFLGCVIFGNLGALVPDLPGDPEYAFENLSLPMAMCGEVTLAILPALVAPAVACSLIFCVITSLIFIIAIYIIKFT